MVKRTKMSTKSLDLIDIPKQPIRVFVPATVANVACGYDVLGFAVEGPGDEVTVKAISRQGLIIKNIEGDGGKLPLDPRQNTITVPVFKYLEKLQCKSGFEFELIKNIPFSGGMGSSSASSVAGVYAVNELLGRPLNIPDLLPFAMEGEQIACGSAHADNVAPALLGGFVVVRSYSPLDIVKINVPKHLYCVIVHPDILISTADSRKVLPKKIHLKDAVRQWGNVAGLITGLMKGDLDLIARSLEDHLIEPVRSAFIPGYADVKNSALKAGALGCNISGSGPSVFALTSSKKIAEKTALEMQAAFGRVGVENQAYISQINKNGPKIIV